MAAWSQDQSRAILVLDASGSMWGQIDGRAKITIAQEVIGDLLTTLPPEQELGLTAYGHRRKGDCTDIETLLDPGTDRGAIAAAVNAIKPKGKTPLSAAVIQAAEALKYTEEAATVILVSDGIETCELDPCEVGRRLEEAGIGFTAHVIGFDVSDPAALAQLQCLAEETGGSFRTASNADELSDALEIMAEPEREPMPVEVTFIARDGDGGVAITDGIVWNIGTDAAGSLTENDDTAQPVLSMMPGTGRASVLRLSDEASAEAMFTVDTAAMTVTLVLPVFVPAATVMAPDTAPAGSLVSVQWTGPDEDNDYLASADADMSGSYWHHYEYSRNSENGAVLVRMPPEPGSYEIRYVRRAGGNKVLARRVIEVTPLSISFDIPAQAEIGTHVPVGWTGPNYKNDFLSVANPAKGDDSYVNYSYTRDGSPLLLEMPPEPGIYEIRYVMNASNHVAARTTIEVVDAITSVTGPQSAPVGSEAQITWKGPGLKNDYVAVARVEDGDGKYFNYSYVRDGNPLDLTMPAQPGQYELRYVMSQDRTVLARSPIEVTDTIATLDAPATAHAGEELVVNWTGPAYANDYIDVAATGEKAGKYEAYTYTREGSPLRLQMPTEPGEYELRYVMTPSERRILTRHKVQVTAVDADLKAPDTAPAASELSVTWTGPAYKNDYIAVAKLEDGDNTYEAYEYTREGSPLMLQMPTEPGEYELRYITQGTERKALARRAITVAPVTATLTAPDNAQAGSDLVVEWIGPGYRNDYIAIAQAGAKVSEYEEYTYTRDGSPLRVDVPGNPGAYELRYIVQGTDRGVIATRPLQVDPVGATLEASGTAAPGSNLVVTWSGPDYPNDYIAISLVGDKGYETYARTSDGSPLIVKVPDRAGAYEVRYVMNQDRSIVARQPLIVE
ncbi:VWA domain-containing protein [Aliiroseovarius subalbicans]|uniref:vWA domain-containing protein n=1 Tax=Aliiroseovarius subalbicans TaxID=2925840 RepID=UPI001F5A1548|nr:VWA domain-containing protein [uncultured Aliiroseovarius sp.]MCI2398489.1 VWA domain-containing protein [Aliiroseovarius subalbicans]